MQRYFYTGAPPVELDRQGRMVIPAKLLEELGIAVTTGLHQAWHGTVTFEHRLDTVTIWEASVEAMPSVVVDGLEVLWAGWKTADEALALPLLPSIEHYLRSRR